MSRTHFLVLKMSVPLKFSCNFLSFPLKGGLLLHPKSFSKEASQKTSKLSQLSSSSILGAARFNLKWSSWNILEAVLLDLSPESGLDNSVRIANWKIKTELCWRICCTCIIKCHTCTKMWKLAPEEWELSFLLSSVISNVNLTIMVVDFV